MHTVQFLRKSNRLVTTWAYDTLMSDLWKSSGLAATAIFLNSPSASLALLGLRAAPLAPVAHSLSSGTWGLWHTAAYSQVLKRRMIRLYMLSSGFPHA